MNTIALITEKHNNHRAQWQFDRIMAAIAYDVEPSIIFLFDGVAQLQNNQAWKSMEIYGIENIFKLVEKNQSQFNPIINYTEINDVQLNQLIRQSDLIL